MNIDESTQQFSFCISHFLSITMYRCYYVQFTVSVNKIKKRDESYYYYQVIDIEMMMRYLQSCDEELELSDLSRGNL